MISRLSRSNADAYLAACEWEPVVGAQLRTDMLVCGEDSRNAEFWVQTSRRGTPLAAISRIDGRGVWVSGARRLDRLELAAFLQALDGFGLITAPEWLTDSLDITGARDSAPVMEYRRGVFGGDYGAVAGDLSLDELYALNAACFPGFAASTNRDAWIVYTSHLLRHGYGFAVGVREEGRLLSTAGVYAISPRTGVIACVATDSGYRGRDFAALLVRALCDRLIGMGRIPALFCAEESLADYYARMGFRRRGRWGRINWGGNA